MPQLICGIDILNDYILNGWSPNYKLKIETCQDKPFQAYLLFVWHIIVQEYQVPIHRLICCDHKKLKKQMHKQINKVKSFMILYIT